MPSVRDPLDRNALLIEELQLLLGGRIALIPASRHYGLQVEDVEGVDAGGAVV